jgi:hypothetical protein
MHDIPKVRLPTSENEAGILSCRARAPRWPPGLWRARQRVMASALRASACTAAQLSQ